MDWWLITRVYRYSIALTHYLKRNYLYLNFQRSGSLMNYKDANSFSELSSLLKNPNKTRPDVSKNIERITEANLPQTTAENKEIKDTLLETFYLKENITLSHHKKAISTMSFDKNATRLITGSRDYTLAIYDFAGMSPEMDPQRLFIAAEGVPVRKVELCNSGEFFVVAAGNSLSLLDKFGSLEQKFRKGDPYIKDMRRTEGHVGNILDIKWHPTVNERFLTTGQDGTVRVWNASGGKFKKCENVLMVKPCMAGAPTPQLNRFTFTDSEGKLILVASSDNKFRIYPSEGPWIHAPELYDLCLSDGAIVTDLAVNDYHIAVRSTDDALRVWDLRNMKAGPFISNTELPTIYEETSLVFSPDNKYLVTGTSAQRRSNEGGKVVILDRNTLCPVFDSINLDAGVSAVTVSWPSALNQLFVGTSDGSVKIFYDKESSYNGILLPANKSTVGGRSTHTVVDISLEGMIQSPYGLASSKNKRKRAMANKDPFKPEPPLEGPGTGGRLGSSVTQSIMKNVIKDRMRDEDPREALLKYAEIAEKDPRFVTPAYLETQPTPIYDVEALQRETEEKMRKKINEERTLKIQKRLEKRDQQ